MRFLVSLVKKTMLPLTAISLVAMTILTPLKAQTIFTGGGGGGGNIEAYLYQIMQNTYGILQMVDNLPTYMTNLTSLALSWLAPDDTQTTANMQANFATFGNLLVTDMTAQNATQTRLMGDLFKNANAQNLPNANDLAYSTLLGMPFYAKDPRNQPNAQQFDPGYEYIKNAAGFNLAHEFPSTATGGQNKDDVLKYANYYDAVMAVESFNGYVLSNAYADYANGSQLNSLQTTLVTQASSSDWFARIATERIGVVLRQLLMYQSQAFVLITQMLQTEKQMLQAQVMTNTLLIAANTNNEKYLYSKASGTALTP